MVEKRHLLFVAGASLGALITFKAAKALIKAINEYRYPFEAIGTVSELYIYPVKSARGRLVSAISSSVHSAGERTRMRRTRRAQWRDARSAFPGDRRRD
jgi:hypothetical protein